MDPHQAGKLISILETIAVAIGEQNRFLEQIAIAAEEVRRDLHAMVHHGAGQARNQHQH